MHELTAESLEKYNSIRSGGNGFYPQKRGLFAVWGKESIQFLNGLITNDMKTLEDGAMMKAAFPNAQGRLLAVVRVLRQGERFLIETEEATREKIWNNLFRFTFAGEFFAEDLSDKYSFYSISGERSNLEGEIEFERDVFVPIETKFSFPGAVEISDEVYEVLRIEKGIPLYGVDMDETTIVSELGIDGIISYTKGCYIGQEIIARIYFRGHVAKQLKGLFLSEPPELADGGEQFELKSVDGKNAGKITSVCYSPKLEKYIALGFVRYDYLANGTELKIGNAAAIVQNFPIIN